jgi:hypothetical protein
VNTTASLLVASISIGYLGSAWTAMPPVGAQAPQATSQASSRPGGRGGAGTVDIPPVPNPPLYPDAADPKKPMHYSVELLRRIHEVRKANALKGVVAPPAPGDPRVIGQNFRTHNFGMSSSGYGITFRGKYEKPRPSQATGVIAEYDDGDQHEGVTDFVIMAGGSGQFVVDGELVNREYGRDPRTSGPGVPSRNTGSVRVLFPGEFHGQPVKNGHAYNAKAGDWIIIPPGVPHWWIPTAGEGMSYVILKVNIGLYPPSLID